MCLLRLSINNVRNLRQAEIHPSSRFNLIYGANASGKTSLLEAIYLLGFAKSFRTANPGKIIHNGESEFTVFGQIGRKSLSTRPVAIRRNKTECQIKLDDKMLKKRSELSLSLPIQIINPESHQILEQGPKFRRHYLDWGVFHVKHGFLKVWKEYCHILKQRNASIRHRLPDSAIKAWDIGLLQKALEIDRLRRDYLGHLTPVFEKIGQEVFELNGLAINYKQGWARDLNYQAALDQSFDRDKSSGFTHVGPHRADIQITINGQPAVEFASRGQQKLIITALKLAQVTLMKKLVEKDCPVLVDDLASELDENNRGNLLQALDNLDTQVFITATEESLVDMGGIHDKKMFHVKHGVIQEVA